MNKGDTKGQRKRYKKRYPEKVKAVRDRYQVRFERCADDYKNRQKEIDERNVLPFERMWGIG